MMNLIVRMRSFAVNDEGQDLLEYALLIALIALVCVGAITIACTKVQAIFSNVGNQLVVPAS